MSSNGKNNAPHQHRQFVDKSDTALVEILRLSEDLTERNCAFERMQSRHNERVEKYVRRRLPTDWIEPTKQQIWRAFYAYIIDHKVEKAVPNLLITIARNKCADAAKQVKREREIEMDYPVEEYAAREEDLYEEEQRTIQQFRVLYQHVFMDSLLTGCQRVLLELRRFHHYRSKTVGRLLGKTDSNIDAQLHYATRWVKSYFQSDEFRMAMTDEDITPPLWQKETVLPNTLVIDRFSKKVTPQFTPDELKPLGITMRELKRHFEFSLMFPHSFHDDATTLTPPFLLLTRKIDQRHLQRVYNRLKRNPDNLPDEFPVEGLIKVDVEDDNFKLRVEPMMQIFPDPEQMLTNDQYMLIHSPRMKVPIALATYDEQLSEFTGDRRVWRKFYDV